MGSKENAAETSGIREQIIQAGMRVFANIPFAYVTLQDVATEAEQEFSTVERHFGTKEGLYRKVFESAIHSLRRETAPIYLEWKVKGSISKKGAQEAILKFIESLIAATNSRQPGKKAFVRVFLSEMLHPSPLYEEFFHKYFTENYSIFADIIMAATGSKDFDWAVYQATAILGMISSFHMEREFLVRFLGIEGFSEDEMDCLKKLTIENVGAILGVALLSPH